MTASPSIHGRRLDPDVRRNLILDCAADLVAREGVASVSMEQVAREAGVSKALVYAYFRNQTVLLQDLLRRDHRRLWDKQMAAVTQADSLEQLVALTTSTYLRHVEENGAHLERLLAEPTVAAAFKATERREEQRIVDFLADELSRTCAVPLRTAALAIELSMGMTGEAGEKVARGELSREEAEDLVIHLFCGSIESLRRAYGGVQSVHPEPDASRRKVEDSP